MVFIYGVCINSPYIISCHLFLVNFARQDGGPSKRPLLPKAVAPPSLFVPVEKGWPCGDLQSCSLLDSRLWGVLSCVTSVAFFPDGLGHSHPRF